MVALRGWPLDPTKLAVRLRLAEPEVDELEPALARGELIRSYAFRGGAYIFTPDVAAVLLRCRTATRVWETARYQRQGGFALADWQPLREAVRGALSEGPATRAEIAAHLARERALGDLAAGASGAGSDSLYKPLHWWGDICFGPSRDGQSTFRLLDGSPGWPGLPSLDEAGPRAIELYLASYGPATLTNLEYWLTEGLSVPRRRVLGWLGNLGDRVSVVEVDGVAAYLLSRDVAGVASCTPADAVRLLPAYDPWILGPGTADTRLISPSRRALASNGSNLVVRGGVVTGNWRLEAGELSVCWFDEAGSAPRTKLAAEAERLSGVIGRELRLRV